MKFCHCMLPRSSETSFLKTQTIIVPVVLYGGESWSLTELTEQVLRRIFGPKREEVAGGWRRLHNEELHNLYASFNIIRMIKSRRMRWVGHAAHAKNMSNVYKIMARKTEGKRRLEDLVVDGK
jgi:hypothetical protein